MKNALLLLSVALSTGAMAQTANPTVLPTTQTAPTTSGSDNTPVYSEKMPVPPVDIRVFLAKNMIYPDSAKRKKIQGKVAIEFAVNEDGTLGEFKARQRIGYGCEEEAIRVLKTMPPWTPGILNGKPVKVYYMQSVNFELH